jgi:hypothetical protein
MPNPLRAVPYLALRPWHVLSDGGEIEEIQTEQEARRLRDDGYIVIKHPEVVVPDEDDGA